MKTREERMHELLYSNDGRVEQCEYICKLEEDLAAEQALNNSLINFDVVETKALNEAQKEYIRQQNERIASLEELVRDMWRDCICQSDVTCNTCVVECNVTEGCALERRIMELGIEVLS
jgi:hypothetical protein